MNNVQLAVQFFLQLAVVLTVCRVVGLVARRFGQPQVVAEMIAGVMLGPSLFGLVAPGLQEALFPWDPTQSTRDTQSYLFPASQLGLALYMFVVGMEFRVDIVRAHLKSSIAVSAAGMLAPFVLGGGLGYALARWTQLVPERTSTFEVVLFLGASLCITAFPMLARIIHFKGLAGTRMGTVAIGAGALDDATAWVLLALVLASFDSDYGHAARSIGGGAAFVLVALFVVRPLLARLAVRLVRDEGRDGARDSGETIVAVALVAMALGAWCTDALGLHAVFGAFVMGAVIPRSLTGLVVARIQPLTVTLLLPLFFTYSGLNTRIGLLNEPAHWLWCGLVLVVAVLGKGVACWLAARATGVPSREALGIGVLMNARGLMELIIINIGLQRGIISPELFAILVLMAVVTTLMASPLFDRVTR
jgi:Kef-type K+ transport system membrane component KefB